MLAGRGGGKEGRKKGKGCEGGLSSWVSSGSHHVPPRRPASSCGPGPRGRKLDTGLSTAGMLWERFVEVCVRLCIFVWRSSGTQETDCYPVW